MPMKNIELSEALNISIEKKKNDTVLVSDENIDCGYALESPCKFFGIKK